MQVVDQNWQEYPGGQAKLCSGIVGVINTLRMSLVWTISSLFAGVKTTLADKAGNDAGFDRGNVAATIAFSNEMSRQAIQGMKGGWPTIGPAGTVDCAGFPIHETGDEATAVAFCTDAAGADKRLIVGFQHLRGKHLRHDDALTLW